MTTPLLEELEHYESIREDLGKEHSGKYAQLGIIHTPGLMALE